MGAPIQSVKEIKPNVFEVKADGMVVHTDGKRVDYLSSGRAYGFAGLKFETEFDRRKREKEERKDNELDAS
jgi:hypothetical protein